MTETEFTALCRKLNLPLAGFRYLEQTRSSEPPRPVRSRVGNVITRYTSRKMGAVISTESRTVELPLVYLMEYDRDVVEFFDQPSIIKLAYTSA